MKESKELLIFILSLGNAAGKSMENGKIDFRDSLNFWQPMTLAEDAFEGLAKITAELTEATPEQFEELNKIAADTFNIPQDRVEAVIEKGIKAIINLIEMVTIWKRD